VIEDLFKSLKMYGALEFFSNGNYEKYEKEDFLRELLKAEISKRANSALKRRLTFANFPISREWEQIDHKLNPKIDFKKIKKFSDGQFLKEKKNFCFIGGTGVGKTHSAVSIGKDLCRMGYSVKCYTACDLVIFLEEAKNKGELSLAMKKIMSPTFLIIDELGFVPFSENGARLLFDVFSKRYEKGSIGITTNLAFHKWPQIFGSIELTQALIDRFTHRCDVFVFEGESIRLMESREALRKNKHTSLHPTE